MMESIEGMYWLIYHQIQKYLLQQVEIYHNYLEIDWKSENIDNLYPKWHEGVYRLINRKVFTAGNEGGTYLINKTVFIKMSFMEFYFKSSTNLCNQPIIITQNDKEVLSVNSSWNRF